MPDEPRNPRIFISVAEQSADEHAAGLVRAFKLLHPAAQFNGLAGAALRAEGCECFHDMTAKSAMAAAAIARIPEGLRLMKRLRAHVANEKYDAAVVIDSPALNLSVAKICRNAGIPVLYYIAPQTWAWGWTKWRNARLRDRVSRVACIWPFEEPHFRADGIDATFVGHPSFDRLCALRVDEERIASLRKDAAPVLTILPGSRGHVIDEVLPGQLEIAKAVSTLNRKARFLVVAANEQAAEQINAVAKEVNPGVKFELLRGEADRAAAIRAADLVLVASGTITLEVAFHGTPMIVMYNTARWGYELVGRWLLKTPFLSIPNILAGREIVPEFMPYYKSTDPIIARVTEWLATPTTLARVRRDLQQTLAPLAKPGAAANAARMLDNLSGETM
ncbi:MAG: lipid-A-disaccharide synthase [Planctomycetes bacterium]|nr:lipid-A-disaccharide synthase [Planctomycetota bacterium]